MRSCGWALKKTQSLRSGGYVTDISLRSGGSTAVAKTGFPPQIKYIIGNEACERFSFYCMRSILVVFMMNYLAMPEHKAKGVFHLFVSASYFLPLLGGYLSDRFLGKYK